MINLLVSEAYAFDYLAILMVKAMVPLPGAAEEYAKCRDSLSGQIGSDQLFDVLRSWEYVELQAANREVWNMVSKAALDQCKASDVDRANQRRYLAKKSLQERFWPTQPLVEVKAERSYA